MSAVAASEPPPRPAATGIRFAMRASPARLVAPPRPRARRGRTDERVASKPVDRERLGGGPRVGRPSSSRSRRSTTSCLPSSRRGPTTSARLSFAGSGGARLTARARRGDELLRRERLRAHVAGRSRPRGRRPSAHARRARRASEFGERLPPVRERPSTTCLTGRSRRRERGPRKATSAESTLGGGRKTVRETGWKPVRRACELDEHRHGAVRLRAGCREEAVGDLALHHHAPELDASAVPSRLSTTIGVATLYGRLATSFVARRIERARSRGSASPEELDVRAAAGRSRGAARARGRARRRGACDPVGQVRGEHAEPRGRSRARRRQASSSASRRSLRGCSGRRGSAGRAACSGRRDGGSRKGERDRGVGVDPRCELVGVLAARRRAPRRYGRRSRARSAAATGCGAR